MSDRQLFTEEGSAEVVAASFAGTADPRLKRVLTSLVEHLHAFVKDVELTDEEWGVAIDFLTRTGHMSNEVRQEFILLSDVLGVSMLVETINHRTGGAAEGARGAGPVPHGGAAQGGGGGGTNPHPQGPPPRVGGGRGPG